MQLCVGQLPGVKEEKEWQQRNYLSRGLPRGKFSVLRFGDVSTETDLFLRQFRFI